MTAILKKILNMTTFIIIVTSFFLGMGTHSAISGKEVIVYDRSEYKHWVDTDGDCQNTRHEVLIEESMIPVTFDTKGCRVIKGMWKDPYTDRVFTNPRQLDIDHLVPLKEAHGSGGYKWTKEQKQRYANDLDNKNALIAVYRGANREKGARDPSNWLPENIAFQCEYVKSWIAQKSKWHLTMDSKEKKSINRIIKTCK